MSKKLLSILIVLVIVLVVIGVWLAVMLTKPDSEKSSGYSAVVLVSGDIYFGKLSWFPWPKLTHVWLLQRTVDAQNQPQVGLTPFTSAFWGPTDELFLNPKEVVFWADLKKDSQVAKGLDNPQTLQPPAQQQGQAPQGQAPQGQAPAAQQPAPAPKK